MMSWGNFQRNLHGFKSCVPPQKIEQALSDAGITDETIIAEAVEASVCTSTDFETTKKSALSETRRAHLETDYGRLMASDAMSHLDESFDQSRHVGISHETAMP